MKATRASTTAEQMAFSRAIESRKPEGERICHDPYAEKFLSAKYRTFLLTRGLRDAAERLIESLFAGHHYYVIARTRCFDDFLQARLSPKPGQPRPQQLVILGAGYDSRALRFADRLHNVKVFEVDHPATSAEKQARLRAMAGAPPREVTFVPVDFTRETLAVRLRESGYRDGLDNVFLWEGVTPYLTEEAVSDVLRFIRSSSAPGSALVFDYILESVVDGSCILRGARKEYRKMQKTREPLCFGIADDGITTFLGSRGFRDIRDASTDDLKARYFDAGSHGRYVKPWWRIVEAVT
jgi:methyltransferase (TIGR00027 family)